MNNEQQRKRELLGEQLADSATVIEYTRGRIATAHAELQRQLIEQARIGDELMAMVEEVGR